MLYIFIFLHQTTTFRMQWQYQVRCISLYSYIKPQHRPSNWFKICGCISLYSYIKPQPSARPISLYLVVYLYIPTSNHNRPLLFRYEVLVVYLYIPTSNHNVPHCIEVPGLLYIFIFLHQTTTGLSDFQLLDCCISLYSYIKPQPPPRCAPFLSVVYLYIPTSNHNETKHLTKSVVLYIFIFLHQTTTANMEAIPSVRLYIFIFLHQTTTQLPLLPFVP